MRTDCERDGKDGRAGQREVGQMKEDISLLVERMNTILMINI